MHLSTGLIPHHYTHRGKEEKKRKGGRGGGEKEEEVKEEDRKAESQRSFSLKLQGPSVLLLANPGPHQSMKLVLSQHFEAIVALLLRAWSFTKSPRNLSGQAQQPFWPRPTAPVSVPPRLPQNALSWLSSGVTCKYNQSCCFQSPGPPGITSS